MDLRFYSSAAAACYPADGNPSLDPSRCVPTAGYLYPSGKVSAHLQSLFAKEFLLKEKKKFFFRVFGERVLVAPTFLRLVEPIVLSIPSDVEAKSNLVNAAVA